MPVGFAQLRKTADRSEKRQRKAGENRLPAFRRPVGIAVRFLPGGEAHFFQQRGGPFLVGGRQFDAAFQRGVQHRRRNRAGRRFGGGGVQHQRAEPGFAAGDGPFPLRVELDGGVFRQPVGEGGFELGAVERRGQFDAAVAPRAPGEPGDGQKFTAAQHVVFRQRGPGAAAQQIAAAVAAPGASDPVREREGGQHSRPVGIEFPVGNLHQPEQLFFDYELVAEFARTAAHPADAFSEVHSVETAEGIPFFEQRGDFGGQRRFAAFGGGQQHHAEPGMDRQPGQFAAARGQAVRAVEGSQLPQQPLRGGETGGGRRVEPAQLLRRRAPAGQFEGEGGQLGVEDFRRRLFGQLAVVEFAPQPQGGAGGGASGASGALRGRRFGDAAGFEERHAGGGRKTHPPLQPGIHHQRDPVDGQAAFGDVGREHHLAPAGGSGSQCRILFGGRKRTVQRQDQRSGGQCGFEHRGDLLNLPHAGQENEHVASLFFIKADAGAGDGGSRAEPVHGFGAPTLFDRELAARRVDHRRIAEDSGDPREVERRGHDDQFEFGAQVFAQVERQREVEVGVEAALVEFVEDHQPDAVEHRIVLKQPQQHALGDHENAGPGALLRVAPHDIADPLPDRFAEDGGDAAGGGAGGDPARFEQQDFPGGRGEGFEQGRGDQRGLARARRGGKHGTAMPLQS